MGQVVKDHGHLCQATTDVAIEQLPTVSSEAEVRTLNGRGGRMAYELSIVRCDQIT